jgi:hypothetical protein
VTSLRSSDRRTGNLALRLMVFVLLVGVGAGGYYWLRRDPAADEDAGPKTTERKTPSVITAIQSLARLEGVSFHMERVIDIKTKEQALWGLVEAEDSILLVAVGDVVAGVDLSKLRPGDITLNEPGHQARLVLPPPEVFSSRLDSQRTYVHARDTDLLAEGGHNLETEARKRAEVTIHDAALKAGILEHARRNTAHTLRALAGSFGYQNVIVEWRRE